MSPAACWRLVRTYLDAARHERRRGARINRIMAVGEARYWAERARGRDIDAAIASADRVWSAARRAA